MRVGIVRGLLAVCLIMTGLAACSLTGEPALTDPSQLPAVERTPYKLGAGDQIRVIVYGEEGLTGLFTVNPEGKIAYPLIGDVDATGRTLVELANGIASKLSPNYVKQPRVSVEMQVYRPFYILGEVNRPGTYPYIADLTVMNAVATAGGFSYRADSKRVFIKHAAETFEREYSLTSITPVLPGDTVRISERRF